MAPLIDLHRCRPSNITFWVLALCLAAGPMSAQAGFKDFFGGDKRGGGDSAPSGNKGGGGQPSERRGGGGLMEAFGNLITGHATREEKKELKEAQKEVHENRIDLFKAKLESIFTHDKSEVKKQKEELQQSIDNRNQIADRINSGGGAPPPGYFCHGPSCTKIGSANNGGQTEGGPNDQHKTEGQGTSEAATALPGTGDAFFPPDPTADHKKPEPPLAMPPELGLGIGGMLDKPHPDQQGDPLPWETKDLKIVDDKGAGPTVPGAPDVTPMSHPTPAVKEKFDKRLLARRVGQKGIVDAGSAAPPAQEGEADKPGEGDPLENKVVLPDGSVKEKDDAQVLEAKAALSAAEAKTNIGDLDGALREADRSFKAVPNPRALNAKAKVFITKASKKGLKKEEKQELYLKAIETAEAAIRMDGKNAAAYELIAWAKLRLGNYIGTVEAASHAIELKPRGADAYAVRAFAHEQLGQKEETLRDIEKAAEYAPAKYARLARAAKRGERIFDPNEDEGLLSDSIAAVGGRRVGPMAVLGTIAALLGVLAGLILLLRSKIAYFLMSEEERLRSDMGAQLAAAPAPKAEDNGLLSGKYQLSRIIGKGGMGQVWEAQDHSLGRVVAVKKMTFGSSEQEALARELYVKEARTLASLHHPNIVDIYEIMDQASGLYLVFELLSGKTVQHLLAERKRLPLAQTRDILKPVCEALDFAHGRGIVHRDLKPSNIMVTDQGYVKVMDFGIARRMEDPMASAAPANGAAVFDTPQSVISGPFSMARTRTIAGTPAYMAPEAESGLVSAKTDVYALGVCLYEMMTGELPFGHDGGLQQRLDRSYVKANARVPGLPPAVDDLIYAALDPNVEARLSSPRAFFLCLQSVRDTAGAAR